MKPRIAVSLPRGAGAAAARARYVAALQRAGAQVLAIQPGDEPPREFDALLLAGGEDVDPRRYGEPPHPLLGTVDPERDALELDVMIPAALARDVPVLGICRGFQVLNVAFGGSLIQHLDGHEATANVRHEIVPAPGSRLAAISGAAPFVVNSRHHQGVGDAELAPGLAAEARVGELIEALASPTHRFVVAVQWHPERTAEVDAAAVRVFDALVAAAREPVATA